MEPHKNNNISERQAYLKDANPTNCELFLSEKVVMFVISSLIGVL